ncbi:MAG: DUF721 domain-containing protein [Planctomycetes bacterium]|nr:DUF721 domain-containing protein [Planctomycetota bacterium]MCC6407149.1 DUF721 domain-containing protein [Planctomycetota bacterium]
MSKHKHPGPLQIGEVLDRYFKRHGLDEKLRGAAVIRTWDRTVGPLAARARAVRFRDGELIVEVDSAPHLAELTSFTGENYRRAINQQLGREAVKRVTFQRKR